MHVTRLLAVQTILRALIEMSSYRAQTLIRATYARAVFSKTARNSVVVVPFVGEAA